VTTTIGAGGSPALISRRDASEEPAGPSRLGAYLVFLILVGATIPWRSKTYFEGGADPVVIAKAALSLAGLAIAVLLCSGARSRPLRLSPWILLSVFLGCTVLGGWAEGNLIPSAVIAIRVALLAVAVTVLTRVYDSEKLIECLLGALGTVAVVGAVTGLPSLAEGRLSGGIPPLHPNELASTSALVALWCLWKIFTARERWWHLPLLLVALGALLATGSRTPLAALAVATLVLLTQATAVKVRMAALMVAVVPILLWALAFTGVLESVVSRGEDPAQLATLSNRTIAWTAALGPKDSLWLAAFGGGLSMKRIEVPGQWWNEQILDSSWISALVQGGWIGFAVCLIWVLSSAFATRSSHQQLRALQLPIIAYLGIRGVLESGLFDATTAFLVFFTTVMSIPLRSRQIS
jgi:hypothetical protein